jgi:secondary thiamine-phosphate synthase enzyme
MTKSSTVTVRETPVQSVSEAAASLVVRATTLTVDTRERVELIDLTGHVMAFARASGVREGTLSIFSLHTTCSVFINETQNALYADIKAFLEQVVAREGNWKHNDPDHSDCDRSNADSHLRAMLLGHSLTLQVTAGEIVLGQWQRVLLAELDGPRERTVRLQVMGTSGNADC